MNIKINRKTSKPPAIRLKDSPEGIYLHTGTKDKPETVFIVINCTDEDLQGNKTIVLYKGADGKLSYSLSYQDYIAKECLTINLELVGH